MQRECYTKYLDFWREYACYTDISCIDAPTEDDMDTYELVMKDGTPSPFVVKRRLVR
jgi:hypothetical protein